MILRFRLGGVDLSYDNNMLTVGGIFKLVFSGKNIITNIYKDVVTVTSDDEFIAMVTKPDNTLLGISFEAEPRDTYGDRYSIDISNVSVLEFTDIYIIFAKLYEDDKENTLYESINKLTLKLYKASILDYGIALNGYNVDNAVVELDSCNILCVDYKNTPIGVNVWCNNWRISNTNIDIKNCNIVNTRLTIGAGVAGNKGYITNTNVTLTGCNINANNEEILTGVGVWYNQGEISKSNVTIKDCNMNTNNNIRIGVGVWNNSGKISNSSVIVDDYNMNTNNHTYIGVGLKDNKGEVTNSSVIDYSRCYSDVNIIIY